MSTGKSLNNIELALDPIIIQDSLTKIKIQYNMKLTSREVSFIKKGDYIEK